MDFLQLTLSNLDFPITIQAFWFPVVALISFFAGKTYGIYKKSKDCFSLEKELIDLKKNHFQELQSLKDSHEKDLQTFKNKLETIKQQHQKELEAAYDKGYKDGNNSKPKGKAWIV